MTAPVQPAGGVDVLAVMDRMVAATARAMRHNFDYLAADDFASINEQRAARAAVAELIAADREYDEARALHDSLDSFRSGASLKKAKERRAAALTAIGAKVGAR